jgi:NTP pyrophosphatase (non-canonical NTP hydrolase)
MDRPFTTISHSHAHSQGEECNDGCKLIGNTGGGHDRWHPKGMVFTNRQIALDYLTSLSEQRPDCYDSPSYFPAKLAEEAGEAVKEGNRRLGFSRHAPDIDAEAEELADVVISAYAQAIMAGINLDDAVQRKHTKLMNRSWKQEGQE